MTNEKDMWSITKSVILGFFMLLLAFLIVPKIWSGLVNFSNYAACSGEAHNNKELYYYNANNQVGFYLDCKIGNSTQDAINVREYNQRMKVISDRINKDRLCYDQGKIYNFTFDLINDYNLSCEKIKYLNDHFLTESSKLNVGHIEGHMSGFLSYDSVKGDMYQYEYDEYVATGKLIKSLKYHLDCNNLTQNPYALTYSSQYYYIDENYHSIEENPIYADTRVINFYESKDYIIYYTNHCIN